jgi:hypothetical protein
MECNVCEVLRWDMGDSINIMGALERRALVSHKQDENCAIVLRNINKTGIVQLF